MRQSYYVRGIPTGNPLANALVVVVGVLALLVSVVLGFFAFIVLGSIVAVLASIVGIRVWWFKRKMRGQMQNDPSGGETAPKGVIEGEYRVVADDREGE